MRIVVIQMHDEADRDEVLAEVIDERAASGMGIERPALGVEHEPAPMLPRRDLSQLLDADAVLLRIDAVAQIEARHQLLRERAAAAFREKRVLRVQLHARLILGLARSI